MVIVLWYNYKTCREKRIFYDRYPHPPRVSFMTMLSLVLFTVSAPDNCFSSEILMILVICSHFCLCITVLTDRPPPIIRQGPSNQTLGADSVALLKCQASGDPIPSISWLKDGVSLLGKDARMSLQELGSLQIKNIKVKHFIAHFIVKSIDK